jgi:hypothetical protein
LGIEPKVFRANNGMIIPHDPVFKYEVAGTGDCEELQYQIMHNGKKMLWCAHDCLGNIILAGYDTAHQAMQALEAHLNSFDKDNSPVRQH